MEFSGDDKLSIVSREHSPYGLSYEEWTQRWWEWLLSIPKGQSPLIDENGRNCSQMQFGPVWFLAGTTKKYHYVLRNCMSPKNIVLLPIYNELNFGDKVNDLPDPGLIHISIDGKQVSHIENFRVKTKPFNINVEPGNVFDLQPGEKTVNSDGYWLMSWLPAGDHLLDVVTPKDDFISHVKYNLSIIPFRDGDKIVDKLWEEFAHFVGPMKAYQDIIIQSAQSPRLSRLGEVGYDASAVRNNVKETMDTASRLARRENRNYMEYKDLTNAIIYLGLSLKWDTWPFCE